MEARLAGQDRTIFRLLSRTGLRAGELFGLQWQDVNSNQTVSIQRTFSKGEIGPPKTKASAKPVALPKALYAELIALQKAAVDPSPTGWVFPSSKKRGKDVMPIASENWLKRVLKPVAALLGFAVTLHMFRRGFATGSSDFGGMPQGADAVDYPGCARQRRSRLLLQAGAADWASERAAGH